MNTHLIRFLASLMITVAIIPCGHAQPGGTVHFGNDSSCRLTNSQTASPVTLVDNIKAALYWSPLGSNNFSQIGAAVENVGHPLGGIIPGDTRTNGAGTTAGGVGEFQVRAWGGGYATYEQAASSPGTLLGQSAVLTVTTGNPVGDPPTPPASLVGAGLQGFTLAPSAAAPLVLICASNKSVTCGDAWNFDTPATSGGCSNVVVTELITITNGSCPQLITRTWSATDSCGASNICDQTVTVIDLTPPVISCATNKTVECGILWAFDEPTASDTCSGTNVSITILSTVTNGVCPQIMTRTWVATDPCGNTNTCAQTVTVADTTPPVLTCASNKTVGCGTAWTFDEPVASDDCSTNVLVTILATETNGVCPQIMTRTWVATDPCGNTNTCAQTVTVADTTPPVLTCASNKTVGCGTAWTFDEPVASDDCSTNVLVTILGTETNGVCPQFITRTWLASDSCGNTNTCSQVVTVISLTPPIVTCTTNKIVSCTNAWAFDPPSVVEDCAGTNMAVVELQTATNSLCPLTVTRTWGISNLCNTNFSTTCSQTVVVFCPDCPVLALTKACPQYPPPPGGILNYSGTVTNLSDITLTNVTVVNNQPAPGTVVFGPATLAPGEGAVFAANYSVPACDCGPMVDTLMATGFTLEGVGFTNSLTAACAVADFITPGDTNGDGIVDQTELNAVLANYWANSQWIYMTNPATLGGGNFQFALTNAGAWNFTVLVTTNFVDWTNLPGPAFPVYQFHDPEAVTMPQRYYRLQWP